MFYFIGATHQREFQNCNVRTDVSLKFMKLFVFITIHFNSHNLSNVGLQFKCSDGPISLALENKKKKLLLHIKNA